MIFAGFDIESIQNPPSTQTTTEKESQISEIASENNMEDIQLESETEEIPLSDYEFFCIILSDASSM